MHAALREADGVLTPGESTFRNAKLGRAALVAYKAAADAGAKMALFVITVVAARRLSPFAFGVFAIGTTIGWLLSVATDFGVQMHLARAVARTPEAAPALLRAWGQLRVAAAAAGLVALASSLLVMRLGAAWTVPLLLFAAAYSANSLVEFLNYFYRGLSRTDLESTLTIAQRAATLVCALAVLAWRPGVNALAVAMLIPALVTLGWSARVATSQGDARIDPVAPRGTTLFQEFRSDVMPIGVGIVLSAVYFRIDVLLVEWWAGTEAVARYNAVFRLIDALRLFPAAVLAVMLPALCRADDFRPLARVATGTSLFALAAAVILWIGAERLVTLLYGAPYRAAVPAFRILALTFPWLSMNYALTQQLIAWDQQRAFAVICAAALAANLALNAWLIPAFSIAGAAWATLGTEIVLTSGCVIALRQRS